MKFQYIKVITIIVIFELTHIINAAPLSPTNCPLTCTCDLTSQRLTISLCKNQTQSEFTLPSNFTLDPGLINVTSIYATNCLIETVPSNICEYPNLTVINFSRNKITNLLSSSFDCLSNLNDIFLDNNNITTLTEVFNSLKNIQSIHLANNKILEISQNAFIGLSSLNSLELSNNQLKFLAPNMFDGLTNLSTLELNNNQIQEIPSNAFNGIPNLKNLDLSSNQISIIDNSTFSSLPNLERIFLSSNIITQISNDTFTNLNQLQYLYLSKNKIDQQLDGLFNGLTNLHYLDLSDNLLTTMELWPTYLSNISLILLRFNRIEKFTNNLGWYLRNSSLLPPLSSSAQIDLQYNNITQFDDETIAQYGVKTYDDFSELMIKYLSIFNLEHNPIFCNCKASAALTANSIILLRNNSFLENSYLYNSYCYSPIKYSNTSLLTFDTCLSNAKMNNLNKYLFAFVYIWSLFSL